MGLIKTVRGKTPEFGNNHYIAENATIVGDVKCGDDCTFWFNAVVRGDVNSITIGNKVNIQDGAVIHCTYEKAATIMEDNVSVGHNAMVHGCTVKEGALIGMGSIVMDHAIVGKHAIVAAGAVVLENTIIEDYSIYAGVPAKKVKQMDEETATKITMRTANNYVKYASWFKDEKIKE